MFSDQLWNALQPVPDIAELYHLAGAIPEPTLTNVLPLNYHHMNPAVYSVNLWRSDPFTIVGDGVECDESKMEVHRPYPFKMGDAWLVAVRHSFQNGDVGLYDLSRRVVNEA